MGDYLLDTGILIRHLRKCPGYYNLLDVLQQRGILVLSVYTRIEIIRGMRESERDVTYQLLNSMVTIPVNIQVADQTGELVRGWREKGFVLSDGDAIIAATGLAFNLELVTTNARHFPIPELTVWQADETGNLTMKGSP